MKIKLFLLTLGFAAFASTSYAQTAVPGISKTQVKHSHRIKHGVKNGELTLKEAGMLGRQQAHIQRAKRHAKQDQVVTKSEKAKIHRMQKHANRKIFIQKHDRQDRN